MRKTLKVLTPKGKRNQCRWKIFSLSKTYPSCFPFGPKTGMCPSPRRICWSPPICPVWGAASSTAPSFSPPCYRADCWKKELLSPVLPHSQAADRQEWIRPWEKYIRPELACGACAISPTPDLWLLCTNIQAHTLCKEEERTQNAFAYTSQCTACC